MWPACVLAFGVGFLSLSNEILWVRLFSFANQSVPQAFAFVLMMYLLGIACGALLGKRLCEKPYNLWETCGFVLLISALYDCASPWIYSDVALSNINHMGGGYLVLLAAFMKAIVFPIAHQIGTVNQENLLGRSLSRVYVANIFGATLGPILIGFFLLDLLSTQQCFWVCGLLTLLLSLYCFRFEKQEWVCASVFALSLIIGLCNYFLPSAELINRIANPGGRLIQTVETKQGIVTVYRDKLGDIIYGGNVYDGRMNLNPIINSNGIDRLILLRALVERPQNILLIGLSAGTWLTLLEKFPDIQSIDVIEINPGYLQVIQNYLPQWQALQDSRVHFYWGDGRRWLQTHHNAKYDLIVMNTTFHWRAYSTNLLSAEFIKVLRDHLKLNGVVAYNTTSSQDAFYTAASVFKYAYLFRNFVIAADFDWRDKLRREDAVAKIASLGIYPPHSDAIIANIFREPLVALQDVKLARELEVVHDNNLITEYKFGKRFVW